MPKKPRVVMVNGCFDLLHPGHVAHLQAAARLGDRLVVALTVDSRVDKGEGRPVLKWNERAMMLRALKCVDDVCAAKGTVEALHVVRPAVLVKGTDWRGKMPDSVLRACKSVGAELVFTNTPKQSTTELIKRIKELP